MLIKEIDEDRLIKMLTSRIPEDKSLLRHIGDDASVIKMPGQGVLVFASDMIVENVHFKLKGTAYNLIGHKVLARNISDIAAMGARPKYATVSLAVPKKLELDVLKEIYKGIKNTASKYKITIAGGDISSSNTLVISIALLGLGKKNELVYRHQAKKNDLIFVTGSLGGSIKGKHLKFTPRLEESRFLVTKFKPSSMIDISDSLAEDLGRILIQSNLGAQIYENKIPISKAATTLKQALYDGEDYELLFTISKKKAKALVKRWKSNFSTKLTQIGVVTEKSKGFYYIGSRSEKNKIETKSGYRHFK
jgi:thiamine-monophosphate kinase